MSARDELQQWVEGTPNTVGVQVDGKIYYSMDVDLARRVLDEMDEQAGQAMLDVNAATHGQELIRQKAIEWRNERDAALATLAEVRVLRDEYRAYLDSGQNQDDPIGIGPLLSVKGVVHALTEILDRSTP